MKLLLKVSALGVAAFLTASASATTYNFGSYAGAAQSATYANTPITFNPSIPGSASGAGVPVSTTNVIALDPGGIWHDAIGSSQWVSYGQTGPTTLPANQPGGNYAPNGKYYFQTTINLDANAESFVFKVLADDTLNVYVDGIGVNALVTQNLGGGNVTCEVNTPNCLNVTTVDTSSPSYWAALALLTAGSHTVTFEVLQNASIDMGFDFESTVTTQATPEPSTLMLLGTGLIGSAGALMRRMRA